MHSHRSGTDDNCCSLFIDADNSALLTPPKDETKDSVKEELAFRTVSTIILKNSKSRSR